MTKKTTGDVSGYNQLKSDLSAKTPKNFYLFYGEEDYLRRYYLSALRRQLLDGLTDDFNFHRLTEENFTLQELSDSLEALPMMAERSLVLIEDVDLFALPEGERSKLAELLSELPEYCCLILTYEEFKPDKRKKKLWEALEKNAVMVEFRYQSEHDLKQWINRHFKANQKLISPVLCTYLLERCGVSMTHLDGEIEKICAYSGAPEIVQADIDAVVEPTLEAVVFDISDALAQRRFDRALECLHTAFQLREEPIYVLGAIGSQMRRLHAAKVLLSEGKSGAELAELCGIAPFAANKTVAQARRISDRFCEKAVLLCYETDYKLKSTYDDGERLLETLVFELAEVARHD